MSLTHNKLISKDLGGELREGTYNGKVLARKIFNEHLVACILYLMPLVLSLAAVFLNHGKLPQPK